MLVYTLKSAACLAILFVFYKLFLEKESVHKFKRFYLLGALVFSLLVPALVFTEYVEVAPDSEVTFTVNQPEQVSEDVINVPPSLEADVLDIEPLLWGVYFLGLFFFGLKFIRNLLEIFRRIRRNPNYKLNRFTQVLLEEKITPHTFFNYIFLNKTRFESKQIPKEVLLHEETHAQQKHSWDVVFVELLQVIFWVNPFIYLAKNAIKLNHEFLADQAVLQKNIDETTYKNTLLSYLSSDSEKKYQPMANAINYSSTRLTVFGKTFTFGSAVGQIKKRFTIMKTQTSKKAILFRSLLLLPLLALMLYGFSEKKKLNKEPLEKIIDPVSQQIEDIDQSIDIIKIYIDEKQQITVNEDIVHVDFLSERIKLLMESFERAKSSKHDIWVINTGNLDIDLFDKVKKEIEKAGTSIKFLISDAIVWNEEKGEGIFNGVELISRDSLIVQTKDGKTIKGFSYDERATKEQVDEYNLLAKKYNTMIAESESIQIKKQDVDRLEYIYSLMSDKQKADAEPYPDFPEPPPAPKAPRILKEVVSDIPPPTPVNAPRVLKGEVSDIPPPPAPPKPQSPLDHVIEMAKKDATFYYEGKKISPDMAIKLLKKNEDLNIQSNGENSKKPTVKISKEPIYLDRSATPSSIETGNIEINGDEGFFSKKDGITTYFNSNGEQIDKTGKVLHKKSENNPKFFFDNRQISSEKANRILSSNSSVQMTSKEYKDGGYAILLTDLNSRTTQDSEGNNNPNSGIDLTEMIAKDALFFHNDKPITVKKALWLTQNNRIKRVNTIRPKKGKPKVYFWDKA